MVSPEFGEPERLKRINYLWSRPTEEEMFDPEADFQPIDVLIADGPDDQVKAVFGMIDEIKEALLSHQQRRDTSYDLQQFVIPALSLGKRKIALGTEEFEYQIITFLGRKSQYPLYVGGRTLLITAANMLLEQNNMDIIPPSSGMV